MKTNRIIMTLLGISSIGVWNAKAEAYESLPLALNVKTNVNVDYNLCNNIISGMNDNLLGIRTTSAIGSQCSYNIEIRQIKQLDPGDWHRRTFQIKDPSNGNVNHFVVDIKCFKYFITGESISMNGGRYSCFVEKYYANTDSGCSWIDKPSLAQFQCAILPFYQVISMDVTLP